MKSITFSCVVALGLVMGQAAFAQPVDANGNGTFSIEEIATAYPGITVNAFNVLDTDESGELSTAELAAAYQKGILVQ